ncbi:MAG: lytic transglycosylase domain-containing protein [Elusimicrobiota bacterium]
MRRTAFVLCLPAFLAPALLARAESGAASAPPLLGAAAAFYDGGGAVRASQLPRMFDRAEARADLNGAAGVDIRLGVIGPRPIGGAERLRRFEETERPLLVDLPTLPPPPEYQRTFRRLEARPKKTDRYNELILRYADRYGLDPRLVKAVIAAESEFYRKAVSPAGALGLMQLMPRTAREMGVSRGMLFDPESNIRAGAAYLAQLFSRVLRAERVRCTAALRAPMWVVQRVLAAYNAGPRFLYRERCPRQIRDYIRKVLLYYRSKVSEFATEMGDWISRASEERTV